MKKYAIYMMMVLSLIAFNACTEDEPLNPETPDTEVPGTPEEPEIPGTPDNPDNSDTSDETNKTGKILIAYFSWGGTTGRMAEQIASQTGGTLFCIEPVTPYPTNYTACTEVALDERDNNARPPISGKVENMDDYNVVFIGCPVWWHTAPMIISTFTESYDFEGKMVVPFCTYASTSRDETLAKIVELTPDAEHLTGLGCTSSGLNNTATVTGWLKEIGIVE